MMLSLEEYIALLKEQGLGFYAALAEKYGDKFSISQIDTQLAESHKLRALFEQFSGFKEQAAQGGSSLQVTDGQTVIIGFAVVFAVLLVLTAIFYLFGFVMDKINKPSKKTTSVAPAAAAPTVHRPIQSTPPAQNGVTGEVVAAISAAVTMMAPEGKRYVVKSVTPKNTNSRSAWAAAGIADNTRPF